MTFKLSREVVRNISLMTTAAAAVAIGANGVFAGLNTVAKNATPQDVAVGTLKLTLGDTSSFGKFSDSISNLAIGDTVNRYVDLVNSGTLATQSLTLSVTTSADSTATLVKDAVSGSSNKALALTVRSCAVAWSANGTCSAAGGSKLEVQQTVLDGFNLGKALATTSLAGGSNETLRLQISVSLPDQDETVVNGVLPANTVQGGIARLTYTFNGVQRPSTVTNS